jgi:hypothetical protein
MKAASSIALSTKYPFAIFGLFGSMSMSFLAARIVVATRMANFPGCNSKQIVNFFVTRNHVSYVSARRYSFRPERDYGRLLSPFYMPSEFVGLIEREPIPRGIPFVGSEKSGIPYSGNSGTPSDSRKS